MKNASNSAMRSDAHDAPSQFSIYNTEHQSTLEGHVRFEISSLIGRAFYSRLPPALKGRPQLLNLGCGHKFYIEYVNGDFFYLRKKPRGPNFWGLDLRYPFRCPDNYWDGVYTEHTLEHLSPDRVLALLREVHRTMKPGCWLRVIVPDISKYVNYYIGKPSHEMFSRWQPRAAGLRSVTQNYLHLSTWDVELMADCLDRAGFKEIFPQEFGKGADQRLLKDAPDRAYESLYVEARKT